MASVNLTNISKAFGKTEIIHPLTLNMESDALTVLVGPSGCGKSTLLRIIAGLETPSTGDVWIAGEKVTHIPPFKRGVSMVFQSYALYPHMTVKENLRFGLTSLKIPKEKAEARIQKAADILGLVPYLDRKPKQLSGGQRQRVAMGRALVRNPKVFLFDEPLSNLDAALRTKMRIELSRLRQQMKATAVYVTHDQVEAMTLADKIVVLRGGKIEQQGKPLDVYHHPANKFVAGFLGSPSMNFIPIRHTSNVAENEVFDLPGGNRFRSTVSSQGACELGVRPEHLSLDPALPIRVKGKVYAVERLGEQSLVYVNIAYSDSAPETQVVARMSGDVSFNSHADIDLGVDLNACHLFGSDETAVRTELHKV